MTAPATPAGKYLRGFATIHACHMGFGEERELRAIADSHDALAKFKEYVHQRLDEAGIPTHPNGPHSQAGCRIGDRLDIVFRRHDALVEACRRLLAAVDGSPGAAETADSVNAARAAVRQATGREEKKS